MFDVTLLYPDRAHALSALPDDETLPDAYRAALLRLLDAPFLEDGQRTIMCRVIEHPRPDGGAAVQIILQQHAAQEAPSSPEEPPVSEDAQIITRQRAGAPEVHADAG